MQLKTILKDSKRQCIKSVLQSSKLEPGIQQSALLQDVSEFLQARVLAGDKACDFCTERLVVLCSVTPTVRGASAYEAAL